MAQGIVANVDRAAVGHALRDARIACAHSMRWLNAVNRAALDLEACRWAFDGNTLQIESASGSGEWYTIDEAGCNCKAGQAGKPCKHRAAYRLLVKASEIVYTSVSTNGGQDAPLYPFEDGRPTFAELQRAADALYG